jgi:amidase
MNFSDYVKHDAVGLAQCVARREVTDDELLALALGQSARAQPKTNAICRMMESEARIQLASRASSRWRPATMAAVRSAFPLPAAACSG